MYYVLCIHKSVKDFVKCFILISENLNFTTIKYTHIHMYEGAFSTPKNKHFEKRKKLSLVYLENHYLPLYVCFSVCVCV